MFLRFKRRKRHDYLLLVENYRIGSQHRQRTLFSFGRRDRVNLADVRRVLSTMPGFVFFRDPPREPAGGHHVVPPAGPRPEGAPPSAPGEPPPGPA